MVILSQAGVLKVADIHLLHRIPQRLLVKIENIASWNGLIVNQMEFNPNPAKIFQHYTDIFVETETKRVLKLSLLLLQIQFFYNQWSRYIANTL